MSKKDPIHAKRAAALFAALRPDEQEITLRQIAVLAHIALTPDASVREASAALGVSKPVISRAIDALAERGLAKRRDDTKDRRLVVLAPTAQGENLLSRLTGAVAKAA